MCSRSTDGALGLSSGEPPDPPGLGMPRGQGPASLVGSWLSSPGAERWLRERGPLEQGDRTRASRDDGSGSLGAGGRLERGWGQGRFGLGIKLLPATPGGGEGVEDGSRSWDQGKTSLQENKPSHMMPCSDTHFKLATLTLKKKCLMSQRESKRTGRSAMKVGGPQGDAAAWKILCPPALGSLDAGGSL